MPYIVDKTAVPPEPERVRSGELWAPDWAVAHALTNGETVQTKLYGQPTHRDGLTRLYTHEDMAAAVPPELGSIPVGALTCGEEALLRAWAAAYAAAAVAAERDCRTCRHFRGQCDSVVKCMDGSGYQRGGAVRLWEG